MRIICSDCHLLLSSSAYNMATGYRVSGTHANPLGMKTDAPWDVIWDVMRAWVADHPVKKQARVLLAGRSIGCCFLHRDGVVPAVCCAVQMLLPSAGG
jgi:hypothetical protein